MGDKQRSLYDTATIKLTEQRKSKLCLLGFSHFHLTLPEEKKNNSILLFILCVACKCRGGVWGSLCSGLAPLFNVNVKVSRISLPTLAACLKQWLTCFTGNICVSERVCVWGGLNRGCVCVCVWCLDHSHSQAILREPHSLGAQWSLTAKG